jgi:ABC-type metal ion transport system substrate-binding protein
LKIDTAVAESILHDLEPVRGGYEIATEKAASTYVHRFKGIDLRVTDLTGHHLNVLGGHAELFGTSSYAVPMLWSRLDEVKEGATVTLPNDATNQARAIILLQQIGWVTLKPGVDPVKSSERDIAANPHKIKLLPLDAAQLPRSLDDVDYAFVNGNFALAAGFKLTDALRLEQIPSYYLSVVAVRTADLNKPYVVDIANAYKSAEFKDVVDERFQGFVKPADWH